MSVHYQSVELQTADGREEVMQREEVKCLFVSCSEYCMVNRQEVYTGEKSETSVILFIKSIVFIDHNYSI